MIDENVVDENVVVGENVETPFINESNSLNSNIKFEDIFDKTTSNDLAIIKIEKFNMKYMTYLMSLSSAEISQEDKRRLNKMYKNRIKGNCFEACYKLGKRSDAEIGRLTVKNGAGLQGLSKDIRNALMKDIYWDVDIKNAQPEMLLQESIKYGWECEALKEYCYNRQNKFAEFEKENTNFTISYCKIEAIRLLFGGVPSADTPSWLATKFFPELAKIQKNICNNNEKLVKKVKKMKRINIEGTVCALYLQTIERKCLMALDNYLGKNGRYFGVLIHDGGGVEKLQGETEFPIELLRGGENFIYETTGYKFSLVVKPIETTFEIPGKRELDVDKSYPHIKKNFEKTHFKCIKDGTYYEIKDDSIQIRTRTDLYNSYEHYVYEELDNKDIVHDCHFIGRWIKDPEIRTYADVNLYPPPIVCPYNHFNLWTGYEIEKINLDNYCDNEWKLYDESEEAFNILKKHLLFLFGEECYDYSEKWLALLIQKPGIKPRTCILLNSKEGLGKGSTFTIIEKFFGKKYCLCTNNIERDIFGDFNSLLNGRLFAVFDEMDIATSSKYANRIKDIVTNESTTINEKGLKKIEARNYLHIFGFSNGDFPWKISESDRRCIPIDRINAKIPNSDYFKILYKAIENKFAIRKLFDYFMKIDISKFDPSIRPITEFTQELKLISLSAEKHFIIDFIEKKEESNLKISNSELLALFQNINPTYIINPVKFSLRIKKMQIDGFQRYKAKERGWKIDIQKAKEWCYKNNYIDNSIESESESENEFDVDEPSLLPTGIPEMP